MTGNVYDVLAERFDGALDRPFLRVPGRPSWSYGDADDAAARYATVLARRGVRAGDRVVAQVAKSPEAVAVYLACLRLGAVYVPLNPAYTDTEVEFFLGDAAPAAVVTHPGTSASRVAARSDPAAAVLTLGPDGSGSLPEAAREAAPRGPIEPRSPGDIAAMLYTSGTTGRSKGAMLTGANLASNAIALHRIWGWEPGDVLLHVLPIFHVHGLFVALHCAMLNASEVVFCDRFDPAAARRWLPESTVMMGVPTHYSRLLDDAGFRSDDCAGMRLFTSGSAPLSATAHGAFAARTGHAILERYGMSEAGMITSNPYDGPRLAGTVGYPLPDVEVRVVGEDGAPTLPGEPGDVEVRGPNVFVGYWRLPDKTAEAFRADGFFRTGDVGSVAADGRLTLAGRSSDIIITGGLNVYPKEVELALVEQDGVAEAAVFGVPHPDLGEAVVACVVPVRGLSADPARLDAALGDRLAPFKRPKRYVFASSLPHNAMGKVEKAVLRARHAGAFAAGR